MAASGGRKADSGRVRRAGLGQWLLGLLLVLAITASVVMIFTSSLSVVGSIAVIAALWAAVIGAILVTNYRRQAEASEIKSRDLRLVYELQLEREINARRQYELSIENEIRREVRAEASHDLDQLKEQVRSLRASLETLLGSELPDGWAALERERDRELAARTADSRHNDGAVAEHDFRETVPRPSAGGSAPTISSEELTDVIPVVTDDPVHLGEARAAEPPLFTAVPGDEAAHRSPGRHERLQGAAVSASELINRRKSVPESSAPERDSGDQVDDAGAHSAGRSVNDLLGQWRSEAVSSAGGRRRRGSD